MLRIQHQMVSANSTGAISRFSTPTPWNLNFSNLRNFSLRREWQNSLRSVAQTLPWTRTEPLHLQHSCGRREDAQHSCKSNKPLVATQEFYWQLQQQRKHKVSNLMNILMLCQQHWPLRAQAKPAMLLNASGWSIYLIINKRSDSNSFCFAGSWLFFKVIKFN